MEYFKSERGVILCEGHAQIEYEKKGDELWDFIGDDCAECIKCKAKAKRKKANMRNVGYWYEGTKKYLLVPSFVADFRSWIAMDQNLEAMKVRVVSNDKA